MADTWQCNVCDSGLLEQTFTEEGVLHICKECGWHHTKKNVLKIVTKQVEETKENKKEREYTRSLQYLKWLDQFREEDVEDMPPLTPQQTRNAVEAFQKIEAAWEKHATPEERALVKAQATLAKRWHEFEEAFDKYGGVMLREREQEQNRP